MAIYDNLIERFCGTAASGTVTTNTVGTAASGTVTTNTVTAAYSEPSTISGYSPTTILENSESYRKLANDAHYVMSQSEFNAKRINDLELILKDILGLLAVMYDRDGPRVDSMSDIRSFIDSIKVIEEGGRA